MSISKKVGRIMPSLTLEISAKAKKMKEEGISVIGFGAGEPDFNTPDYIIEAAKKALDAGFTKYTPASGLEALKKAVCKKYKEDNDLEYEPANIVISSGAKSSLYHALCAIIDEGDEVIIPSPYWLSYPEMVNLAGGKSVFVKTEQKNGYLLTAKQFEDAITDKTKCLILNSPSNPTGSIYSERDLKELAKVAEAHGIYVISDEIYEKLVYGNEKHCSIASLSDKMKQLTIVIGGVSKSYSMTGWRIGYLAAPKEIAKAISSMQSHTTSNACTISQHASIAALTSDESQNFIRDMREVFDERRKCMIKALSEIEGITFNKPKGAFYVFVNVSEHYGKRYNGELVNDSMSFADLALKRGIALVPGVAFGDDNCIRLSYAISIEDIKEGLDRLKCFIEELK